MPLIDSFNSTDSEITFDLTGIDASIANSLRRIMLSEVKMVSLEGIARVPTPLTTRVDALHPTHAGADGSD